MSNLGVESEMENDLLLNKAIVEKNYEEMYRLYDLIYPNDVYNREEGLDADLSIRQKATILSDNGKHKDAILIAKTLLKIKIEEYGEKSRPVQTIRQLIGSFLLTQNELPEALELLEDVLKNQLEILGQNKDASKPDAYETRLLIAILLERQGKLVESLMLYEQVHEAFVEFYGAEVDLTAHVGFTITSMKLKIAAQEKNENLSLDEILKIINYGPNVLSIKNHWDNGKDTILHRGVRSNVKKIVEIILNAILIECGEDKEKVSQYLNFENSEIQTPLTLAVKYACKNSVEILLKNGKPNGLDINYMTSFGENPLKIANFQFQNSSEIIKKLLLEYGAKLSP